VHIGKSFVLTWAALCEQRMGSTEPWLLDNVGPAAAARGHCEPDEFTAVARWKTPRSRPAIAANSGSDIRQITAMVFAAPESLQHRALTLLHGVGVPTATALLAVAFPDRPAALLRDGGRGSDRSQWPPFAGAAVVASAAEEFWGGYAARRIADLTAVIGGSRDTLL
jgi:hypothetical protein